MGPFLLLLAASPIAVHFEVVDSGVGALSRLAMASILEQLDALGAGHVVDPSTEPCDLECYERLLRMASGEAFVVSIVAGVRRARAEFVRAREPGRVWGVIEEVPGTDRWNEAAKRLLLPLRAPFPEGAARAIGQPSPGDVERPVLPWIVAGAGVAFSVAAVSLAASFSADGALLNQGPIYDERVRAADARRQVAGPLSLVFLGAAIGAFSAALYLEGS